MTAPAYNPTGYCRCGYRTDPGICPECGRTNRRMRKRNPKGPFRWLTRALIAIISMAMLFFPAKYILWNWWPADHLLELQRLSHSGPYARAFLSWTTAAINYRTRKTFDHAHARWQALANNPPPHGAGLNGRYFDDQMEMAAYINGAEFLAACEPAAFGTGRNPGIALYGHVVDLTDALMTIEVRYTNPFAAMSGWGQGNIIRTTLQFVPCMLDGEPILLPRNGLRSAWSSFRTRGRNFRFGFGGFDYYLYRAVPDAQEERTQFREERNLLLPPEYCDEVWRPAIIGQVKEVDFTPRPTPVPSFMGNLLRHITLDVGTAHGVQRDTRFWPHPRTHAITFEVDSLSEHECTISMRSSSSGDPPTSWPELGATFRSISDE